MGVAEVGVEPALDVVGGEPALGGHRGDHGGPIEAIALAGPRPRGLRAREHVVAERLGVDRHGLGELGAIPDQLGEAGGELAIPGAAHHRLDDIGELAAGLADVRLGEADQARRELQRGRAAGGVERRQHELVAPPAGADQISGKQRAPSGARWCTSRPCWR